jgi:hypothetical protein
MKQKESKESINFGTNQLMKTKDWSIEEGRSKVYTSLSGQVSDAAQVDPVSIDQSNVGTNNEERYGFSSNN